MSERLQPIQQMGEKGAAVVTAGAGSWLTFEALTQGFNLLTAVMGSVAAGLAIWWWLLKIRRERKELSEPPTPTNTD